MEEENNIKYKNTVYTLNVICNKLENLDNSMRAFQDTLKRSLLIDGETLRQISIEEIIDTLDEANENIKNDIVPLMKAEIGDSYD